MQIEQILLMLQIFGAVTAFAAIPLVAWAAYMLLQTPPKELKQYIEETKPAPPPKPVSVKRILQATVPPEVQDRINELLPTPIPQTGWDRIGGKT